MPDGILSRVTFNKRCYKRCARSGKPKVRNLKQEKVRNLQTGKVGKKPSRMSWFSLGKILIVRN